MDDQPELLTVEEAARVLRIGRTKAYAMARKWRDTDGRSGLPVVDFGHVLRVPRRALEALIDAAVPGYPVSLAATCGDSAGRLISVKGSSPASSTDDYQPKPSVGQPQPNAAHPVPRSSDDDGSQQPPRSKATPRRKPDRDATQLDLFDLPPAS